MSCSSPTTSAPSEADLDDPLCITESDRRQFSESGAMKRKAGSEDESADSKKRNIEESEEIKKELDADGDAETPEIKLELEEEQSETKSETAELEPKSEEAKLEPKTEEVELELKSDEEQTNEQSSCKADASESPEEDFDVAEKLKTMDEISVQPVNKSEKEQIDNQDDDSSDKVSIEITKKDKKEDRKVTNLRKNIKDVIDDTQLDATTLAAQRQESERLARLQEQQRLIREAQRQMAAEKQSNKTQQKVLSILQGSSPEPPSLALSPLDISSSLSITPTAKTSLQSLQSLISTCDDDDSDDDVVIQPDEPKDKSAVVVDSSSDSDDCIILSDEEEEDVEEEDENNSGEHTNDLYNQRDSEGRVVVNIGHDEKEENIYVAPQIARIIKHHQIGGVRFLFDNIIESVELFDKSSGFGCILAHSMGLGKTLQLVCFCDIFLRHTNSKSILVIMPINTLQNWLHEFNMWLPLPADVEKSPLLKDGEVRPRQFNIFVLNDSQKTLTARARTVLQWSKEGGVLMMGYEMYRLLSLKKQKKKRGSFPGAEKAASASEVKLFDDIHSALVNPGPDLIVCDEGHRIKNAHASTSVALKQIRSKRRIVLTGYPLQNNLLEYWCMVDFVRPSYLGTKTEFSNMFERPIQNGQCIDSTPIDCKLMRHRAHVLHSLLKGFVQRRSQMVLQKCLPEKREFVLLIRMTPFQRKLYSVFMDEVVRSKKVPNPLKAFAVCCKIWNHPDVLYNFLKKRELDLDIELEEAEAITSGKSNPAAQGPKKRGRKTNESKGIKKEEKKGATEDDKDSKKEEPDDLKPVKLEATASQKATPAATGESFKTSQLPPSNGSAYSSNQSMSSNFDSSSSSFNSYSGYPNYDSSSYQNYNNYNNNGNYGYQNWQGQNNGNNYWQNNFYQSDFPQQNYYPQQSQQQQQPSSYQPPYYANSNYQSFEQKPSVLPKVDSADAKSEVPVRDIKKLDGGLLADEIKEEAKELQDKSSKDKDDSDTKDPIAIKSSRDDGIPYDWAVDLMKDYVADLLETSPKMEIFFCILEESITVGDRLLVFSQSLLTLNIMERFLQKSKTAGMDANWARNVNYFRLDGSTAALEREKLINEFNSNTSVKLFLVSTRAGSLGINLVGANRVIVFDASWNPCHDTQAVCRVYRYGQAKSCFVYRFVMDNCLEKKIYDRQINKQGMADRVVDECNPDAHLSMREVTSLCYDDGEDPELKDFGSEVHKYDDLAMKKILESHSNTLTKEPFQHDSLLVDRKEMKLSQAEKRIAQRNYEKDKQAASKPASFYGAPGSNYRVFRTTDGSLIHRPVGSVRPVHNEMPSSVMNTVRPNPPRPTRWVPVEVWQSKGLTAQEMTLPQDVSIQTNAADKSKIYLKAGQKVIVLKSPKGICLQLESGKVIAIRASVNKNGPQIPGSAEQKIGGFMQEAQNRQNFPVGGSVSDVIDISNDDDDDDDVKANVPTASEPSVPLKVDAMVPIPQEISNGPSFPKPVEPNSDPVYKDKVVYKPNLVPRKPKLHPSTIPPPQDNRSQKPFEQRIDYQPRMNQPPPNKWENYPNPVHQLPPPSQVFNGGYKNSLEPYRSSTDVPQHAHSYRDQPTDPSAFHQPGGLPNPYPPPVYPPQNVYQNAPYQAPSYPPAQQNNFGYPYHNASYPNAPSYQYSPQTPQNYDQNYPPYQGINYNNQITSTNTIPTDQSSH